MIGCQRCDELCKTIDVLREQAEDLRKQLAASRAENEKLRATFSLVVYISSQVEWSGKTFGPGPRTGGLLEHIRSELVEIEGDPHDLMEWVDVMILAFDGAWRAGWTPEQIVGALQRKQAKNFARKWPPPGPQDRANYHVKEGLPDSDAVTGEGK